MAPPVAIDTSTYTGRQAFVPSIASRAIEAWVSSVSRGSSVAALILGPREAGQTVTADALNRAALHAGFVVARASARHERQPFGLTGRLVDAIGAVATNHEAGELSRRLRAGLGVANRRPTVLIVEDADELPIEDLAPLLGLAVDPPRAPMLLALTVTEKPSPALVQMMNDIERSRAGEVLRLGGLALADANAAIDAVLPAGMASLRFTRDLLQLTDGRAGLIAKVVDGITSLPPIDQSDLFSGSRLLESWELPTPLADSLRASVLSLPEHCRQVANALAVWDAPATVKVIVELLDCPDEVVVSGLEQLESARIVCAESAGTRTIFRFNEPLVGRAITAAIPTLTRQRLHRRAADMGEQNGAGKALRLLAEHYLEGRVELTRARVETVADVAHALVDRSRYASARQLLRRLLENMGADLTDPDRLAEVAPSEILVLLGETLSRAGDWHAADALLRVATDRAHLSGAETLPGVLRLARDRITVGGHREALQLYRSFLDQGHDLEPRHRVRLLIDIAYTEGSAGNQQVAMASSDEALEAAVQIRDSALATEALISKHIVLLGAARPRQAFEHVKDALGYAHHAGNLRLKARAISGVGNALCDADNLTRGVRWIRRAHRLAEECEDYATVSWTGARLASALVESGDWDEAHALATRIARVDASLHRPRSFSRALALLRLLECLRGPGHAASTIEPSEPVRESLVNTLAWSEELRLDDDSGVLEIIDVLDSEWDRLRGRPGRERAVMLDVLPRLIQTAVRANSVERVEAALRALDDIVQQTNGEVRLGPLEVIRGRAALAAVAGQHEDAARGYQEAAAGMAALGHHWRAAQSRVAGAIEYGKAGARDEAVAQMNVAYLALAAMGQGHDTRAARAWFATVERRPPRLRGSGPALSKRELDVARLASEGFTDAAIGDELGIARRTVTTHMQRVLSKLQINSRADVAEHLHQMT